jgi:hypothetical protein
MKKYVMNATKPKPVGFWGQELDPKQLAAQHQFLEQMQIAVTIANREVIHGKIPNLTPATFHQLAVMVARFRADYLEAAIRLSNSDTHDEEALAELKHLRELFDEGCSAFEALERAIERGYVDLGSKLS